MASVPPAATSAPPSSCRNAAAATVVTTTSSSSSPRFFVNATTSKNGGKSNATVLTGEKTKMRVSDFVAASFARFEEEYGTSATIVEGSAGNNGDVDDDKIDGDIDKSAGGGDKDKNEDDMIECDEEDDESFWMLLTTLYLPLLLIGVRRSTFGTVHFLRSLFLGHVLRLVISVVLFSIPPSATTRMEKWWASLTQVAWVQHVLWALTGDERYHPNNHYYHLQQYYNNHNSNGEGGGRGQGGFSSSGSFHSVGGGGVPGSGNVRKCFNPDHVWPPPALTLLTLITVLAFVVHPDGLTWIVLGKAVDGLLYFFRLCYLFWGMTKDGTIPTVAASAVFAVLLLFGSLIHRIVSSKPRPENGDNSASEAASSSRSKHKKGKKGRNGRHGHQSNNARGRGKVRGGHFRSTKDLYQSPTRKSRSRSASPSRSLLSENIDSHDSQTIDSDRLIREETSDQVEEVVQEPAVEKSQFHVKDNMLSKTRPYSVDSMPQLSDDISSCSSIAGSDAPGQKQFKSTINDRDRSLSVTESGGSRRRKRGGRRGKNQTPIITNTDRSKSVCEGSSNSPQTGGTSHGCIPAPPGFVAKESMMSPSRMSPLLIPCGSSTPAKSSASTPMRKPISRPTHNSSVGKSVPDSILSFDSNGNDVATRSGYPPLRDRASTSDGVMKHDPFSTSGSSATFGATPLQSQPLHNPPGIVRYNFPNYAAYAQNDGRYAPGKIELAAFLAQVGLVGSACARLLADLYDVDALASLTSEQLHSYNIGSEKQLEISALLEARRLRLQQQNKPQKQHSLPVNLRPPPGLGFQPDGVNVNNSTGFGLSATTAAVPAISPTRPISQPNKFSLDCASSDFFLPPASTQSVSSNMALPSLSALDSPFRSNASDSLVKPLDSGTVRPFSIGPNLFPPAPDEPDYDDECSKIDADLQQLGNRMVGSILDF